MTILETNRLAKLYDREDGFKDPNWPGPNYYDDCKKFSWKDVLVENHKAYYVEKGLTYPDYKAI